MTSSSSATTSPPTGAPASVLDRFCPACQRPMDRMGPGPNGRPDASCGHCGSLERQRFLSLLLQGLSPLVASARVLLDIAPSPRMAQQLRQLNPRGYLRLDVDPAADRRAVDVQASMTALPFADGSVDVVICYHVLEHVPDDAAAMAELARVLSPGGFALVQVPWRADRDTDEDPSAPVEERLRRFGQADHVRYYGCDFDDRLRTAGLSVLRFTPGQVLDDHLSRALRLDGRESVWLVRPSRGGAEPSPGPQGLHQGTLNAVHRALVEEHALTAAAARDAGLQDELRAQLRQARREAQRWEKAYRRLRGRRAVRAVAALHRLGVSARERVRR